MAKYNLNGSDVENLLFIDNTASGVSINSGTLYNFSNKYKAKIGSSIYSYTNLNYLINGVDQGNLLSPKIKVFSTVGTQSFTLQPNTKKILCICLGGGAGGSGGNRKDGGQSGGGGSGGGGGGLAWLLYKVNGGETFSVSVGDGGNGGSDGSPVGMIGSPGVSSLVKNSINTILCIGYGGNPGIKSTGNNENNNDPSTSGTAVSGFTVTSSFDANALNWGTKAGLVGGNGQKDPENDGQRSQNGYGGAGGNGGTTSYRFGKGIDEITSSFTEFDSTDTVTQLQFNNVDFLDLNVTMDPNNTTFTQKDFYGTNAFVEDSVQNYGEGGCGGNGEGRNAGAAQSGFKGNKGFVIIVEYGV